jgi:hypothetical protein
MQQEQQRFGFHQFLALKLGVYLQKYPKMAILPTTKTSHRTGNRARGNRV